MFVVNFDFSSYAFLPKLLAINLPVLLTELATYPLQRLQVQLIKREAYYTGSQAKQLFLVLGQMLRVQGFPKFFHGLRYSLDYSITQMTFKFFLFDHLMVAEWAESSRYATGLACAVANAAATFASQSAFNYQTIASSLEPSSTNTTESVKHRLVKFTQNKSPFFNGLRYTLPVSLINSIAEIILILKLQGKFLKDPVRSQNELAPLDTGYTREELIIAWIVLSVTSFTSHFAVQRQVELCFDLAPRSLRFSKGLLGSYLRNTSKGMLLYALYFKYFDWLTARALRSDNHYESRSVHNRVPGYNRTQSLI